MITTFYVQSASNPWHLANDIYYPFLTALIFQGFLLNGLWREVGFAKANVATGLFYGFWFNDLIGCSIYCLFLNLVYRDSTNLLFVALVGVLSSLVLDVAYMVVPEIWILKSDAADVNSNLVKAMIVALATMPLAIRVVVRSLKLLRT